MRNRRARLVVLALGVLVLMLAGSSCGGDSEAQEPDAEFQRPVGADTIEDAQSLVDFRLAVPADVPPELEFERAFVDDHGDNVTVFQRYRVPPAARAEGGEPSRLDEVGVWVSQSTAKSGTSHPSSTVEVQGTAGILIRGEDIGNPGLVAFMWQKDGFSFDAYTFPDERFTEEEFLRFLNSLELADAQD